MHSSDRTVFRHAETTKELIYVYIISAHSESNVDSVVCLFDYCSYLIIGGFCYYVVYLLKIVSISIFERC